MMIPKHFQEQFQIPWPLPTTGETKRFFETTHRLSTPEETFERFGPRREAAGITRLADITKLDVIGIPTYNAMRPQVDLIDWNITVYNGKGLTKMQAKVSAMMEAFERHAAERHRSLSVLSTYEELSKQGHVIHPEDLILDEEDSYEDHELLEWVCGTDLMTGEPYWVPMTSVICPYVPPPKARSLKNLNDTSGLASGNTLGEAISHALSELIERDADILACTRETAVLVDLSTIQNPMIVSLMEKFHRAGIHLWVREVTSELEIPSFSVSIDDPITQDPMLICAGSGTHVDAEIALMRALTEAAQSRCAIIAGTREDLDRDAYRREKQYEESIRKMDLCFQVNPRLKDFREIPIVKNSNTIEDIEIQLKALSSHGFEHAIAFNLTRPEVQVPVVRVIVPGLEPGLSYDTRFGPRLREVLLKKLEKLEQEGKIPKQ